jgi:4-amino-4-deoxy-L-arabinose transferase-like glycosyltransferase/membrane-associated phospholipid phosphatase
MMHWLTSLDAALFRFINHSLANPLFDWVMPRLAGHVLFLPALIILAALGICRGGRRARVLVVLLALSVGITDGVISNTIKKAVARPRPCLSLADTRCLIGCTKTGSMPSSHAANWFAGTIVLLIYYRKSWRFMLPAAALISFSRVYDGVHYPSDVFAGAIIGAGTASTVVWSADSLWKALGKRFFPLWWSGFPSLLNPDALADAERRNIQATVDDHWLRLGYLVAGALLLFRLFYLSTGTIELSKDEAYQWLWSKHLALSYYSKPPGIALIQYAGTHLWGDSQFGVRFFSPVFAFILSIATLRFLKQESSGRTAFLFLLILSCAPLMGVGTILMTIDPPLVMFWTLALIAAWKAMKPDGTASQWLWAGAFAGLGFLCKYSAAYLFVCWGLFFLLCPPARGQLKKPGPYLALAVFAFATLPVILWNARHGWITAHHVADNAGMTHAWHPTLRFFSEFVLAEAGLLNPFFFVAMLWAMAAFWKSRAANPLMLYLFCLGGPVFIGHLAYSLHSRILPNWIAPAIVPLVALTALYWESRWRQRPDRWITRWLSIGLGFGLLAVVLMHQTDLIAKITGHALPGEVDPLRRVRAWKATAAAVEAARQNLLQEGKPVFIIADHYGLTGQFTFQLPEARSGLPGKPLVYRHTLNRTNDQLAFWPEYRYRETRPGENAIYVMEVGPYALEKKWLWKWLKKEPVGYAELPPPPIPKAVLGEFESVTDIGQREIKFGSRIFRRVELFECRDLKRFDGENQ